MRSRRTAAAVAAWPAPDLNCGLCRPFADRLPPRRRSLAGLLRTQFDTWDPRYHWRDHALSDKYFLQDYYGDLNGDLEGLSPEADGPYGYPGRCSYTRRCHSSSYDS